MSKQDLILLYGGRSAEREVSFFQRSVIRAIDYQAFSVQTILLRSQEISSRRKLLKKPADDEKLMTNDTVDWIKKSHHQRFTRKEQWSFQCFMDR